MAFDFHKNKSLYFKNQYLNASEYIIPFLDMDDQYSDDFKILDVGCGEGGVLKAFLEKGCSCVGVELLESKLKNAKKFLSEEETQGKIALYNRNIYDDSFQEEFKGYFDLIILKDVIEHIHDQDKVMKLLKTFLKPTGKIFFGFPPWYMPFGGHQQICSSKLLSKLPYYHLLPNFAYKGILKLFGEQTLTIDNLLEIKETGISLERFERIVKNTDLEIKNKRLYFINPIYKLKFGLKPREQFSLFGAIPFIRNFITTCGWYVVGIKH